MGTLLLNNESRDQVAGMVAESDFYPHEHRLIFRTVATLIGVKKHM